MEVVIAIAIEIGKCLVGQSTGHVRYLLHLESNFEDLKKQKDELMSKQKQVQDNVREAERNAKQIKEDVQQWLTNVSNVMEDVRKLEEEIELNKTCFNGWCPNWSWRYRLSKKATKEKDKMVKLLATLPEIIPSKDFMPFETTTSAFDQIMEALTDEKNYVIGLYGIGGVGKTTLAKEVGKKAKEKGLVDVVAIAVVSQTPDFRKIQDQIADFLGLKFDGASELERVSLLCSRLKQEKNILIILDDVWKNLKLADDIGIPDGDDHKGCKVLLTTRRPHVCNSMGSKNIIPLDALSKMEAWALFQKSAALDDNSPTFNVAMDVAEECKGLPLAITAVGSALKGKSLDEYKRAYKQLKNARLVEIEDVDVDKNVCTSLQLSYDYLKSEEDKSCFLMCSLFPEDHEIQLEDLVRYGMGLDLFKGIDSIEDARSQLRAIIKNLQDSSLLLEASRQHFVKMHDVVRDVALWIASKGENVFMVRAGVALTEWPKEESFEQYTAISLMANRIKVLPTKMECPRLKILLLGGDSVTISDAFFEEMKTLKVLDIYQGILSPQSFQFLTNLRTLKLRYCTFDDISSLGKLNKLEILCFYDSAVEELPNEIGELINLRLLDLNWCQQLKRIPPNVISKLSKLEELYIRGQNHLNWEVKGPDVERSDTSIWELNSLSDLVVLSLRLDAKYLPIGFAFPKLKMYEINMGDPVYSSEYPTSRTLRMKDIDATSVNAFKELFPTVEYLDLVSVVGVQNIIPNMDQGGLNNLISLVLISCDEMACLINSTQQPVPTTAFSNLEKLSLKEMAHLREICNGDRLPTKFLQQLKTLEMSNCSNMPFIFPKKLLQRLQNLEEVTVESCDEVQEVFGLEEPTHHVVEGTHVMLLSNLELLHLDKLPKLSCIWKGATQHVNLQRLIDVEVSLCDRLTYIFSSSLARSLVQLQRLKIDQCKGLEQIIIIEEDEEILIEGHVQPLCFSKLTTLEITTCEKLEYIFPISIARGLRQLEKLQILDCPQLKQVFSHEKEEDVCVGDGKDIELPKLREIELKGLSSLTNFSESNYQWMWPSLQELTVVKCPKLTTSFIIDLEAKFRALEKQLRVLRIGNHSQLHKTVILLQNLEELTIENCEGVEEVFHGNSSFSKLKEMELEDLPELRVIWKGPTQISSFQNLTKIKVINCNKLTQIFSPSLARNLLRLELLWIEGCKELERIIGEEDKDEENQIIRFPNLNFIYVEDCSKLKSLFPITITRGLPRLDKLWVEKASQLEEVFCHENEENVRDEKKILLPNLDCLHLLELPRLISFCRGGYHFIFPSFLRLRVKDCPNIITSFTIASDNRTVHAIDKAKTETPQLVKEDLLEGSSTTQAIVATMPRNSDIYWDYGDRNTLPPYMEESSGNLFHSCCLKILA